MSKANIIYPPHSCINDTNFYKLGDFKLGLQYPGIRIDHNSVRPEFSSRGWIFTNSATNWRDMAPRNEHSQYV